MKKKIKYNNNIIPNKKVNIFITSTIILGIISGSIFLILTNNQDKLAITKRITEFFNDIKKNNINSGLALKNSLIINYLFIFTIWTLGLSMIGIIINIFLTYLKGFLVGFTISAIFLTFKIKGLPAAIIYTLSCQLLNIIIIAVLTINSVLFSSNLLKIIISKKNNKRLKLKRYLILLMFSIILSLISSIIEVYLFPNILKLFISLYT